MEGIMKRLVLLSVAFMSLLFVMPAAAKREIADSEALKAGAVKGFEQILDLWRAGNYGELYNRTLANGKETRETFSKRMATAQLKPSCCWEKMQDVVANVKSPTAVVIRAKIGLDAPGEMEYKTKSFKLVNEFGEWRIARTELLSLAEVKKSKKSGKHRVKTVN